MGVKKGTRNRLIIPHKVLVRRELISLLIFYPKYNGGLKESLEHRIKYLSDQLIKTN